MDIGLHQFPVAQLIDPPRESRLLRETDKKFVKNLKLKMILDPWSHSTSSIVQGCFLINFPRKAFKYEVLGGLHAKMELMKEFPNNPFNKEALAEVNLELSDEQAFRLIMLIHILYTESHTGTWYICSVHLSVC